jgi:hypothetical protein
MLLLAGLGVAAFLLNGAATGGKDAFHPIQAAVAGDLQPATIVERTAKGSVVKTAPFFSAGLLASASELDRGEAADAASGGVEESDLGIASDSLGCSKRTAKGGNTRVNQDCSFRRQAEEDIVYNPANPKNLIAGQNDSRVGFNQCGIDYSLNNGERWGDLLPPFRQRVNNPAQLFAPAAGDPNHHSILGGPGTFHTYDAGSDPTVAVDSEGRAYFSCVIFDVFDDASGIYVTQSPKGANGSFYFNIAQAGRLWMAVEDNNAGAAHDKQFIVADRYKSSPNRDNVYLTWTVFKFACGSSGFDYCSSEIYGSMSTDHGQHWSTPEEISGVSPTLCFFGNFFDPSESPNACDFDQGSDPEVLPNGDLVVVFNNENTAASNPNTQQLGLVCHPSGSTPAGTAHLNCGSPLKVGDDVIVGEPRCNFGRGPEECIPGAYIRTNDFPRIGVNDANGHLYVAWQDYRNHEFDVQLTTSTDGGNTWSPSTTANADTGLDHYFAAVDAADRASKADRVGVSYYRTERVPNENTTPSGGFAPGQPGVQASDSDYVQAGGRNAVTPFDFKVLSPVFPAPDGAQAGFNGDYSGLTINGEGECHAIWSDTRNPDSIAPPPTSPNNGVINDEDVFTDRVGCPDGKAHPGPGTIGKENH